VAVANNCFGTSLRRAAAGEEVSRQQAAAAPAVVLGVDPAALQEEPRPASAVHLEAAEAEANPSAAGPAA
jgi:hypothetical protein